MSCPTGKMPFKSAEHAKRWARRHAFRHWHVKKVLAYLCSECRAFHTSAGKHH